MKNFRRLFRFDPEKSLCVGVERECFLLDASGRIAPLAKQALGLLSDPRFDYELSACQLEERIGPCHVDSVEKLFLENDRIVSTALRGSGIQRSFLEVGLTDMPLDVYPDPSGRYAEIAGNMPREKLLAACRVIGTHVHVGMPNHAMALKVYNSAIHHVDELIQMGNGSFGERLSIYRTVAPACDPQPYASWESFHEAAVREGFSEDPRRCWSLIRMSRHGTIEFRIFGSTDCPERIGRWAKRCHEICREAISPSPVCFEAHAW
ncbi:MAG: hypothetical protein WC763_00195 [Candidatus Paceibacterota bacterium]|jgi:gamma-glutamyl:cysteine ligase YbdK (ATP-grasp superfamily)